jgi:hypothetical protein
MSGEYSDKSVTTVFSREADADRACDLFGWYSEEFELDEQGPHVWPDGKRPFTMSAATHECFGRGDGPRCVAYPSKYVIPSETKWDDNERDGRKWAQGSMWAHDEGEATLEANAKLQELLK